MTKKVLIVSLFAMGCVPVDDAVVTPDAGEASPRFSQRQARLLGEALAAGIEDTAERFGPVTIGPSVVASCATPSGDTSDADGDSIPLDATLTFDCSKRRLGFTGTLSGVEQVSDLEPEALAWAFSASADLHASLTGPFGGSVVVDIDGSIVASQGSIAGPFRLTSTLDIVTVISNASEPTAELTESLAGTIAFRPDVDWTPGGVSVSGTIDVDGSWSVGIDARSGEATLSTPTPLTFRPSCNRLITGGAVEAAFYSGGRADAIRVEWSGCGQSAVTYIPEPPAL